MTNHAKYRLGAADQGDIRSRLSTDSMLLCASKNACMQRHKYFECETVFEAWKILITSQKVRPPFCHKIAQHHCSHSKHPTSGITVCLPSWKAHEQNQKSKTGEIKVKTIQFQINRFLWNHTNKLEMVPQIQYRSHDWRFSNHSRHCSGMSRHVSGGYFRADSLHPDFIRGLPKVSRPSGRKLNDSCDNLTHSRGNRAEMKRLNTHHTHTRAYLIKEHWQNHIAWVSWTRHWHTNAQPPFTILPTTQETL